MLLIQRVDFASPAPEDFTLASAEISQVPVSKLTTYAGTINKDLPEIPRLSQTISQNDPIRHLFGGVTGIKKYSHEVLLAEGTKGEEQN